MFILSDCVIVKLIDCTYPLCGAGGFWLGSVLKQRGS